jgi:hypothetical protein
MMNRQNQRQISGLAFLEKIFQKISLSPPQGFANCTMPLTKPVRLIIESAFESVPAFLVIR